MIDTGLLMLIAAMTAIAGVPESGSGDASLSITATVVRPVDISSPSISTGRTVVTLRNTGGADVQAVGGTVAHPDQETSIATSGGAGPMIVTITY